MWGTIYTEPIQGKVELHDHVIAHCLDNLNVFTIDMPCNSLRNRSSIGAS